ncbi:MAG: 3-hydroxyacyl-CoA dehydrogenase NAD-binding domain-containing protein, partial [Planctomycetaceae bacterium]
MTETRFKNFRIERDERGVMTVWIDVVGRPVNVFDESVVIELDALVSALETDSDARAVVFRSGKPSGFFAGADVKTIAALESAEQVETICRRGQELFDRIER